MKSSMLLILAGLLFCAGLSVAQFPTVPKEAIQLVAASGPETGEFFLWFPEPSETNFRATALIANAVLSHAPEIVRPIKLHQGQLLRLNVFALAPQSEDRERLLFVLHKAARDDPYFRDVTHTPTPLTGITIRGLDGKRYTKAERPLAAHLNGSLETLELIRIATGLRDCVFHGGHLISLFSRQTKGGLYYDARGIVKGSRNSTNRPPETGLESYLRSRGFDWALSRAINAESRAYIPRSGVTGKPRVVVLMFGQGTAPHVGPQSISVTLDVNDEDLLDPRKHPLIDLTRFRGSAAEVFVTLPNGHVETTIWDAQWELAQSVPDNVAVDSTIPEPHTKRLEPFHSCIRCHGPHEVWRPLASFNFHNRDALSLLSGRSPEEANALFFTYSGGDLSRALALARNTTNSASFFAIDGHIGADTSASSALAAALSDVYAKYNYDPVTPEVACRELGIDSAALGVTAQDTLAELLIDSIDLDTEAREHPILLLLLSGESVRREEWEGLLPEALTRSGPVRDWLIWDYFGVP